MTAFDLYGFRESDIDVVRSLVESALGVQLFASESSYVGEHFRYGDIGSESFDLCVNYIPSEDEAREERYSEYPVLLYVNGSNRAEIISSLLSSRVPSSVLLRHEEI